MYGTERTKLWCCCLIEHDEALTHSLMAFGVRIGLLHENGDVITGTPVRCHRKDLSIPTFFPLFPFLFPFKDKLGRVPSAQAILSDPLLLEYLISTAVQK